MGVDHPDDSATAHGRALYETMCASCHGISGQGVYVAAPTRPPVIAGADIAKILWQVRQGGNVMPAFSASVLSDPALQDLARYAHEGLAHPSDEPAHIGPRELDPFLVGLFVWTALAVLVCGLTLLFGEGRN